ncbi:MAG TPA: hypothetical protein VK961_05480 [Chthoniobacter sp.]|nr:hypothetical protein [Chthoniobacter sp.]
MIVRRMRTFCVFLLLATVFSFVAVGRAEEVGVPGGTLDVQYTSLPAPPLKEAAAKWIQNSARAVAKYHGTFTIKRAVLRITPVDGHEVSDGYTDGWKGAIVTISLGRKATAADLAEDWQLTHEMLHLGFPNLPDRHHWLEEGIATYVEPIARCRAGLLSPERIWSDMVEGMPQGEPEAGDRGLDRTHTWGRTYWGGALFCLRADVEIRRGTNNRLGLEHALRAIRADGGTIESAWNIDRVIATGDGATGVPVLRELYDEMKATPVKVDLAALWKELGVVRRGKTVAFDDHAPLSATRRAITTGN